MVVAKKLLTIWASYLIGFWHLRIVCVNDAKKCFDFMADKATDPFPNPVLHSEVRGRRMRCNYVHVLDDEHDRIRFKESIALVKPFR
jgi:hypothetical protein